MRLLFFPAISVLNRLNYPKKFALMGLLALVAFTVVIYGSFVSLNQTIQLSQRQLQGLALIEPFTRTIQEVQRHRGFSAALLSGNEAMRDRRAAEEFRVDETFKALEQKLPPSLVAGEDFQHIRQDWERLCKEGLHWAMGENFAAHTRLIEQLQLFEKFVADDYSLTLDSELGSSYLIDTVVNRLPHTLEHLGKIRAFGGGILSSKQISEPQLVDLKVMIGELDNTLKFSNINIEKISRHNPALRNTLQTVSTGIKSSVKQVVELAVSDILSGKFVTPPEAFIDMATTEIDGGYAQIYETLLPATETLIRARIARAENALYTSIGIALLLFLVVGYFAIGNYYVVIDSIQSLACSARAFADGKLKTRVSLNARDELSQVGDCFNEMADGFSAMLETHREDELNLRATIQTAMDAVVQMNAEGIITDWNRQAEKVFGWHRAEVVGLSLCETIIPPQYREAHRQGLQHFLRTGKVSMLNSRVELIGLHHDGHEFPIELSVTAIKSADKHKFNGFIRDITQKKQSDDLIWKQANFDQLTNLPNRHMFQDRLEQEIKKAQRVDLKTALLYINLDKFKEVNDSLGHNMGDTLLKEVAQRISDCVRMTDTVARMGGDEFTVILAGLGDTNSIERVAENILRSLAEPFLLGNEMAYVSASIGVTLSPDDAIDADDLLKHADQAMSASKNAGRNRFSYFTQSMQQAMQARLRLANDLRGALAANQFMVHYQPVVDLATGRIKKAEALIRWQHPEFGTVSPAQFIPLAEETGLIVEIGDWIFREASRQLKRWKTLYSPYFQISVNVSPAQLGDTPGNSCQAWFGHLQELGLAKQSMIIEITEGLLLDANSNMGNKLLQFHDVGIQVAIDDFGTGYSSLSYLKKFNIDYLKIDQSFVRDLATDPNDMALSEAIIVMAHRLGLKVIAEGVETEEQLKLLADAGCDYAQGYLFSKPLPVEEFEAFLEKSPSDSTMTATA